MELGALIERLLALTCWPASAQSSAAAVVLEVTLLVEQPQTGQSVTIRLRLVLSPVLGLLRRDRLLSTELAAAQTPMLMYCSNARGLMRLLWMRPGGRGSPRGWHGPRRLCLTTSVIAPIGIPVRAYDPNSDYEVGAGGAWMGPCRGTPEPGL